jgi:hypothetical protein
MRKFSRKVFKFTVDIRNFKYEDLDLCINDMVKQMSIIGFNYITSNDGIMSYIDIDENISEFYVRDDGDSIDPIYKIFSEYLNDVKVCDCTDEILFNNELIKGIKESESSYDKRLILFEKFRKELTSIDDILDKISEKGIDYIDDIDKEILKTKNPS